MIEVVLIGSLDPASLQVLPARAYAEAPTNTAASPSAESNFDATGMNARSCPAGQDSALSEVLSSCIIAYH